MKITKNYLKQVIKEELERLQEKGTGNIPTKLTIQRTTQRGLALLDENKPAEQKMAALNQTLSEILDNVANIIKPKNNNVKSEIISTAQNGQRLIADKSKPAEQKMVALKEIFGNIFNLVNDLV